MEETALRSDLKVRRRDLPKSKHVVSVFDLNHMTRFFPIVECRQYSSLKKIIY